MRILCIGMSHKTAGVALRERVAFDQAACTGALADLSGRWQDAEFAVLSTCNRTEIYTARPLHGHPRDHELRRWFAGQGGLAAGELDASLYALADADAVGHLLAVAAGLDSLVVGEAQIAAQVKDAYLAATRAATSGATLNLLFQSALGAAKRIRNETGIGTSSRSVASLAIECAGRCLGRLEGKAVLSVGAGKMNHLMLRRLTELGAGPVVIANRSSDRAAKLAEAVGGRAAGFDELPRLLARADVVVASTASEAPIITRSMVADAAAARNGRPLLIVDIAVPRDVEEAVGELPGVRLYDIDDLERLVAAESAPDPARRQAAERIIAEAAEDVLAAIKVRTVAPTIEAMYRYMRTIADAELNAAFNKLATHEDAETDKQILQRALRRTIRRIIHPAVLNLRNSSAADAASAHATALRKLFDLDA